MILHGIHKWRLKKINPLVYYGLAMALLIMLLKWLQWKFFIVENAVEFYVGGIAILFTLLGIWISRQITRTKVETVFIEKEIYIQSNERTPALEKELLDLSTRELEVWQLINKGYSNAEIANELFLSISTIKTHVSNLFVKLDVKSRTQSMEKARKLKMLD
jgi:DNA-binding CsgD family transcriptional regulator